MKRLVAASLWFLVGWTVGAAGAVVLGVSPALGPILAVATAGIVIADPRQIIWSGSVSGSRQLAGQGNH
jgi:hypothetical protein